MQAAARRERPRLCAHGLTGFAYSLASLRDGRACACAPAETGRLEAMDGPAGQVEGGREEGDFSEGEERRETEGQGPELVTRKCFTMGMCVSEMRHDGGALWLPLLAMA